MLTPQEVQEKKFKQSFINGYDMASVDEFLEKLTEDFTNLFKENAVLKNKMKILVDKLEEYRGQEDTVRHAYVAIKRQAEQELNKARETAAEIIGEANLDAKKRTELYAAQLAEEEKRLVAAREQTVAFVAALRELYNRQIDQLSIIPAMDMPETPRERRAENIKEAFREIEDSVSKLGNDEDGADEGGEDSTQQFEPLPMPAKESGVVAFDRPADVQDIDEQDEPTTVIPDERDVLKQKIEENIKSFEITFGPGVLADVPDDNSDIWEPEYDTEAPRPKFDFTGIEHQFGPETLIGGGRKK